MAKPDQYKSLDQNNDNIVTQQKTTETGPDLGGQKLSDSAFNKESITNQVNKAGLTGNVENYENWQDQNRAMANELKKLLSNPQECINLASQYYNFRSTEIKKLNPNQQFTWQEFKNIIKSTDPEVNLQLIEQKLSGSMDNTGANRDKTEEGIKNRWYVDNGGIVNSDEFLRQKMLENGTKLYYFVLWLDAKRDITPQLFVSQNKSVLWTEFEKSQVSTQTNVPNQQNLSQNVSSSNIPSGEIAGYDQYGNPMTQEMIDKQKQQNELNRTKTNADMTNTATGSMF